MLTRITLTTLLAAALLVACAGQRSEEIADKNQAIEDFIDLRELESVTKIRTDNSDGWELVTSTYLIYKTRRADFLMEFGRPCWELYDNTRIVADERYDPNVIRAKFDTLRGCRIAAIYALNEADVAEVRNIGDPPGATNQAP